MTAPITRRQLLAAAAGAAGAAATATRVGNNVWPLLAREDLIPGPRCRPQDAARGLAHGDGRVTFVAVGDTGSARQLSNFDSKTR